MNRIILSAILAMGFHIGLVAFMPSIFTKHNEILLPLEIKSVLVTLSCKPPVIKKIPFKRSINPPPPKHPAYVLKKKASKSKSEPHKSKKIIRENSIHTTTPEIREVKTEKIEPEKKQASKKFPIPLKKIIYQRKRGIEPKMADIEFAKPLYKENIPPVYPVMARRRGYQGIVELLVLVSEKGRVSAIKIFKSSGYKCLDRRAVRAVETWLFKPGRKNGLAGKMWVKIPVKFELRIH